MSCEIDAGRAISRSERPIHHGRIPSRYENCGSAAGKVLAVRAQVHLVVGKFSEYAAAGFDQFRDGRTRGRGRRNGRPAAADVAIVRTIERGTAMKQSDNGITGSHRHDLNNLVGAGINANARPAAAQITAVRAVISAAAIRKYSVDSGAHGT